MRLPGGEGDLNHGWVNVTIAVTLEPFLFLTCQITISCISGFTFALIPSGQRIQIEELPDFRFGVFAPLPRENCGAFVVVILSRLCREYLVVRRPKVTGAGCA